MFRKALISQKTGCLFIALSFFISTPAFGYAFLDQDGTFYLAQPIKSSEWKRLRKLPIKHVYLYGGADPAIFKNPQDLPNLKRVTLDLGDPTKGLSPSTNKPDPCHFAQQEKGPACMAESYLSDLVANYPKIRFLTVRQEQPLPISACNCIRSFHDLEYLEVLSPLPSNDVFKSSQFTRVHYFRANHELTLPKLPNLKELCFQSFTVPANLLDHLDAPSLKNLQFQHCVINSIMLKNLDRFPNLKLVDLATSTIEDAQNFKPPIRKRSIEFRFPANYHN